LKISFILVRTHNAMLQNVASPRKVAHSKSTNNSNRYFRQIVLSPLRTVKVKLKAKLSLCLINSVSRHEGVWRCGIIAPPFLISVLDESEWSATRLGRFSSLREGAPSTPWIAGWVGVGASLNTVEYRVIFWPYRESNNILPTSSPSLYRLSYPDSPSASCSIGNQQCFHELKIH
jgi:hypothetical protein